MTTTYDVEQTESAPVFHDADPTEVVSAYDDPQTVIAAWSSSALGELDGELTDGFTEARERQPAAARAKLFAAVAAGIIGGATLGAVLFGYRDVAPPTVVVPGFGVSTEQLPGRVDHAKHDHPCAADAGRCTGSGAEAGREGCCTESGCCRIENERRGRRGTCRTAGRRAAGRRRRLHPAARRQAETAGACSPTAGAEAAGVQSGEHRRCPDPRRVGRGLNNIVIEAPILDPAMKKPTTNELKPIPSSRWTTKLPDNKPNQRTVNPGPVAASTLAKS